LNSCVSNRAMPIHTLSTRLQSLRQGWLLFLTLFGLGLLRRWILSKPTADYQQRRSRDRRGANAHRQGGGLNARQVGGFGTGHSRTNRQQQQQQQQQQQPQQWLQQRPETSNVQSLHVNESLMPVVPAAPGVPEVLEAPATAQRDSADVGQLETEKTQKQQHLRRQPQQKKQHASSSRSSAGNPNLPELLPAEEHEMGEAWHFGGLRHWLWLHDGSRVNGWLEFGSNGILRTSLTRDERGSWKRGDDGEMVATFGKCHHVLELLPAEGNSPPSFVVSRRAMRDGSPLTKKNVRTLGRLDTRRNS